MTHFSQIKIKTNNFFQKWPECGTILASTAPTNKESNKVVLGPSEIYKICTLLFGSITPIKLKNVHLCTSECRRGSSHWESVFQTPRQSPTLATKHFLRHLTRFTKLHKVTQTNLKTKLTDQSLWHRRMYRRPPCTPRQSWWGRRSCGWRCPPRNVSASFSARRTRLGFLGSTGTSCPTSRTWCPCGAEILAGTILLSNTFNFLRFLDHSVQFTVV